MGHNKQERKRTEKEMKKKKRTKKNKQRRIPGDDVGGDNHVQEVRLFSHLLASFFLLKYSFRRAMFQLEFGESKPEDSQSEQSNGDEKSSVLLVGNTEIECRQRTGRGRMPRLEPRQSLEKSSICCVCVGHESRPRATQVTFTHENSHMCHAAF